VNSGKEPSPQQMLYAIMFYGGAAIGIAGVLWIVARIVRKSR
jgi:hypothetical protein